MLVMSRCRVTVCHHQRFVSADLQRGQIGVLPYVRPGAIERRVGGGHHSDTREDRETGSATTVQSNDVTGRYMRYERSSNDSGHQMRESDP